MKNGALRDLSHLDEERDGLHLPTADRQAGIAMPSAAVGVAARHAVAETAPLVRTTPPLARLEAEVALRRQQSRNGRHVVEIIDHLLTLLQKRGVPLGRSLVHAGGQGRVVAGDLVLVGIPAREDARQAGRAEAGRHIPATEQQALARQPVEPGRADLGMPHEAVVGPGHVVGDDQDDVGWAIVVSRGRDRREAGQSGQDRQRARHETSERRRFLENHGKLHSGIGTPREKRGLASQRCVSFARSIIPSRLNIRNTILRCSVALHSWTLDHRTKIGAVAITPMRW